MLIPLSEDNLSDKIIFNNNTGYLILMLGAVGYSPVVTPHRIKQVCKPYRVVKVAAECSLLARSTNEVWCRGKTVMIPSYFRLCYLFNCRLRAKKSSVRCPYVGTQAKSYVLTQKQKSQVLIPSFRLTLEKVF